MNRISVEPNLTVGDLVVQYPQLRQTLEQLGLDYCCGGKKTLLEAAESAGRSWADVEKTLHETLLQQPTTDSTDWNNVALSRLIDHIVDTHHAFTKEQLPRLDGLLEKVQIAHGEHHGEMLGKLSRAFTAVRAELEAHLMKEEQILFPLIKATEAFINGNAAQPMSHCGSVANPIRQMEIEHDDAGNELAVMRKLTGDYTLPDGACPTFAALYDGLAALEDDLHQHIHLENNILFPKAVKQEAQANA
ncbi:iron-sulfur cluster repair di-iron protein [Pontiella sp. NLcol2]|uniref:Iron-sulfur cluster repair di-iron protein n=2 Tax=Pontiella agarivorans TaxID=3038953 RepID=A0ABU5MVK6_9BACT|nr:iron-sulfur cluster repair di-iron protein [Pontiella agarivorans]